ncbi:MAG TPA: nucleotide excision repair endonuclease [Acidimicrobiales bacterium]|nr:nucleotide excision repair endonuclease [Acidimicrobiales bacterium]
MPADVLLAAAAGAPPAPGVYFFMGRDHDLLYVGKATNLRRRLQGHARAPLAVDRRSDARIGRVRAVAWEECASERDALLREADLIVALRPPYNASHTTAPQATYLRLEQGDATTFRLVTDPGDQGGTGGAAEAGGTARVHGPIPHLAKGGHSSPAKWTKHGYTALLRALWAAQRSPRAARIPRAIGGSSPPVTATVAVDPPLLRLLHRFLSGRGDRLVGELRAAVAHGDVPAYMRPRLVADIEAAGDFYAIGPRRLAGFRRRHDLPPGPVRPEAASTLLLGEVRATVGDPLLAVAPSRPHGLGGRDPGTP